MSECVASISMYRLAIPERARKTPQPRTTNHHHPLRATESPRGLLRTVHRTAPAMSRHASASACCKEASGSVSLDAAGFRSLPSISFAVCQVLGLIAKTSRQSAPPCHPVASCTSRQLPTCRQASLPLWVHSPPRLTQNRSDSANGTAPAQAPCN